jgi:hypothetical protein
MVVEEVTTDWCGEVVAGRPRPRHRDAGGPARQAPAHVPAGSRVPARGASPVILTAPVRAVQPPLRPTRTASGSVAVQDAKARVARASRIFVEGRHDAELVEKVWGDDLRIEGVAVEYLGGVDDLADHLRDFRPGPQRRVGVLVDHLVRGVEGERGSPRPSRSSPVGKHVLIVGHPFVDVWQAVKPERLGLARVAHRPPQHRLEDRHLPAARLAAPQPGRHRPRVEARPGPGVLLRRPRARPPGPGRGADRLHHGALADVATQPLVKVVTQAAHSPVEVRGAPATSLETCEQGVVSRLAALAPQPPRSVRGFEAR